MKIAVVCCEYNPLQNGHVYHLSRSKQDIDADFVLCIMSGNFTQRGEYAIRDKYTRAVWAVKNGADAVVELPPQYVLSTAKYFAVGAVKIAKLLKGDVTLSFGSELGDIDILKSIADVQEDSEFKDALKKSLDNGNGYAKSYGDAFKTAAPQFANDVLSPNNILAIEYIKAVNLLDANVGLHTVKRIGGAYKDENAEFLGSASAVRAMCKKGDISSVENNVPQCVAKELTPFYIDKYFSANYTFFNLLKFNSDKVELNKIHGVKEGIENRISNLLKESDNWESFWNKLTTKRYTDAYLLRTLTNILVENTFTAQELLAENIQFVNALAISQRGRELLSAFDCEVITKEMQIPQNCLIRNADKLYSCLLGNFFNAMQIVKDI